MMKSPKTMQKTPKAYHWQNCEHEEELDKVCEDALFQKLRLYWKTEGYSFCLKHPRGSRFISMLSHLHRKMYFELAAIFTILNANIAISRETSGCKSMEQESGFEIFALVHAAFLYDCLSEQILKKVFHTMTQEGMNYEYQKSKLTSVFSLHRLESALNTCLETATFARDHISCLMDQLSSNFQVPEFEHSDMFKAEYDPSTSQLSNISEYEIIAKIERHLIECGLFDKQIDHETLDVVVDTNKKTETFKKERISDIHTWNSMSTEERPSDVLESKICAVGTSVSHPLTDVSMCETFYNEGKCHCNFAFELSHLSAKQLYERVNCILDQLIAHIIFRNIVKICAYDVLSNKLQLGRDYFSTCWFKYFATDQSEWTIAEEVWLYPCFDENHGESGEYYAIEMDECHIAGNNAGCARLEHDNNVPFFSIKCNRAWNTTSLRFRHIPNHVQVEIDYDVFMQFRLCVNKNALLPRLQFVQTVVPCDIVQIVDQYVSFNYHEHMTLLSATCWRIITALSFSDLSEGPLVTQAFSDWLSLNHRSSAALQKCNNEQAALKKQKCSEY